VNRFGIRPLAVAVIALILSLSPAVLMGVEGRPPAEQIVGTWTLLLVDNVLPDGSRVQLYGPSPQGILFFDGNGHYGLQILRSGRPKFAANDKSKGTSEENQAAVQGSNSHFGTYTVDESSHTIIFHIEHASFPNWEGTEQKRSFKLAGDELTYTVPTPTTGGTATGEVRWKRIR
jgi:Lipocalin-like domain